MKNKLIPHVFLLILSMIKCHVHNNESVALPIIDNNLKNDSIFIDVSPDQHIWSKNINFIPDQNILYINDRDDHSIYQYFLNYPDSIKKLKLPHYPFNNQFSFHPYGKSKYVVVYDPAKNRHPGYNHDSCVYIYDKDLNLLKVYGLLDYHPCVYGNSTLDTCRHKLYLSNYLNPTQLKGNHLLFNIMPGGQEKLGEESFLKHRVSLSGSIDLATGNTSRHQLIYPSIKYVNFPYDSKDAIAFSGHGENTIYYHFIHTNFILSYDSESHQILDTNYIGNSFYKAAWDNTENYFKQTQPTAFPLEDDRASHILYDSIRQFYYRFFFKASPAGSINLSGRNTISLVEVLDTQFRALGYLSLSENASIFYPPPFIHPKGLAIFDLNTQPYGDSLLRIDIYDLSGPLVTEEQDLFAGEDLVATRYREGAKGYRQHWQSDAPRLLYFSYFSTCPSCLEWYKKVILQYPEAFRKGEIDLVLQGNGEEVLQFRDSLAAHEIPVYFDSTGYYQVFFRQNFVNPTLFQEADDFQEGETFQPRQKQQLEILLKELSEK